MAWSDKICLYLQVVFSGFNWPIKLLRRVAIRCCLFFVTQLAYIIYTETDLIDSFSRISTANATI